MKTPSPFSQLLGFITVKRPETIPVCFELLWGTTPRWFKHALTSSATVTYVPLQTGYINPGTTTSD